ncbi:Transglycosylase SLT domain-containing protein OS=Streptomyces aurantiogriseus OX=66870 GN=GCM10010251_95780 PE=4 SV=1 [Streptomyces aurantiogriseus]
MGKRAWARTGGGTQADGRGSWPGWQAGFYGHKGETSEEYWKVRWHDSDCGYGVGQVTDGMRLAGHEKPGETFLPPVTQKAVALDYAVNIAASMYILADKWNEVHTAGQTITDLAAADRLGRHVLPGHTCAQHVDDPPQSRTVIRRQSAWIPPTPRWARREQRSDTIPQVIRHKIIRHPQNSAAHQPNRQACEPNSF